jgi:hypothetical protein
MCLTHLIYTVRPCLIHICHAMPMPMPCSDHAVLLKVTAQQGRRETAVLCCDLKKNGMVGAWHWHGMTIVNQTRSHCVNQMGKTHSKPLAARHGRGTAWARHGHGMLCVNRPLLFWSYFIYKFASAFIPTFFYFFLSSCSYIQGVPGRMCQNSGGCSLC